MTETTSDKFSDTSVGLVAQLQVGAIIDFDLRPRLQKTLKQNLSLAQHQGAYASASCFGKTNSCLHAPKDKGLSKQITLTHNCYNLQYSHMGIAQRLWLITQFLYCKEYNYKKLCNKKGAWVQSRTREITDMMLQVITIAVRSRFLTISFYPN